MENKSFCLRHCILVIRRIVWKYRLIDSRFWSFAIRSEMGHWLFFYQQKRLDWFTLFKNHFSSVTQKSRLNITIFTNDSMRGCKDRMEILAITHAAFSSHSVWLTIFLCTHTHTHKPNEKPTDFLFQATSTFCLACTWKPLICMRTRTTCGRMEYGEWIRNRFGCVLYFKFITNRNSNEIFGIHVNWVIVCVFYRCQHVAFRLLHWVFALTPTYKGSCENSICFCMQKLCETKHQTI